MNTTDHGESRDTKAPVSPWLKVKESADYARSHYDTILKACREYETSKGKRGLKSIQRNMHACRLIHIEDLERWMRGEVPSSGTRRPNVKAA